MNDEINQEIIESLQNEIDKLKRDIETYRITILYQKRKCEILEKKLEEQLDNKYGYNPYQE